MAQSEAPSWRFSATLYVFVPTFDATSSIPLSGTDEDFVLDTHSILDHLKMAFMGTFDAHHDRWGFFVDTLYADIGEGKTN